MPKAPFLNPLVGLAIGLCLLTAPIRSAKANVPPNGLIDLATMQLLLQTAQSYIITAEGTIVAGSSVYPLWYVQPGSAYYTSAVAYLQANVGAQLGTTTATITGEAAIAETIIPGSVSVAETVVPGAGTASGGGALVAGAYAIIAAEIVVLVGEISIITYVYTYEIPTLNEEYTEMSMEMMGQMESQAQAEAAAQAELEAYEESVTAAQGSYFDQYLYYTNPWNW